MEQKPYIYTTAKTKSKKYDIICTLIDKVIKKYNPCNIQLQGKQAICKQGKICCKGCFYLSNNGCTTNCLGCKLTFCPDLEYDKATRQTMKLLKPLYVLAFLNNLVYIRSSKEEVLTQANLTGDRSIGCRSVYSASSLSYFSYKVGRQLIEWRNKLC